MLKCINVAYHERNEESKREQKKQAIWKANVCEKAMSKVNKTPANVECIFKYGIQQNVGSIPSHVLRIS